MESEKHRGSNSKEDVDGQNEVGYPTTNNFYYAYPDVAENVVEIGACLEELRGQLPWSYTQPQEKKETGEEKIELDILPKRHLRVKSDSSGSGEL